MDNNKVYQFYETQFDEGGRFASNPLEYIRSQEIIKRVLTKPHCMIADIAGAVGAYSYWLTELGHKVHLLDLSPKHIEQAKAYGEKHNIELSSLTCGDARQLPYGTNTFDAALLMGALYHLQESDDRMKCIAECHRVLKPGGKAILS
ncbi:MAG: class I SAM-dependent methyltransferase, partial [Spirochaetaceae bacterium]|nr:class I SAM-dependent methyltransferase [Spirochaetaceae bacterium]